MDMMVEAIRRVCTHGRGGNSHDLPAWDPSLQIDPFDRPRSTLVMESNQWDTERT